MRSHVYIRLEPDVAPVLGAVIRTGCQFESGIIHNGALAQLVEREIEDLRVSGSNPLGATTMLYQDVMNELKSWFGTKPSFGRTELMEKIGPLISSLTNGPGPKAKVVSQIRKYDVIYLNTIGMMHYILVHKVTNDEVHGVVISSKQQPHNLLLIKEDRFFEGSYATKTYLCYDLEHCRGAFSRVYESKKEADAIFRALRTWYKGSLKHR